MDGYAGRLRRHIEQKAVEIGSRIKAERIAAGYKSQADFMKEMGYSPDSRQTAANWESGKKLPSLDDLLRMCDLFGCEIGYLLCEEGYECKTRTVTDIQEKTGLSEKAIAQILVLKKVDEQLPKSGQLKMLSLSLENMTDFSGLLAQMNLYVRETNSDPPNMNLYSKKVTKKEPDTRPPFDALFLSEELRKMGYVVTTPKEFSRVKFENCTEILKKMLDKIAAEQKEDGNNGNGN